MNRERDIMSIHENILNDFENDKKLLVEYEEKLENIKEILKSPELVYRVKTNLQENITDLENKIENIKSNNSLNFYLIESTPSIEKYKSILNKPKKMNFIGRKVKDLPDKEKIVKEYLEIANKYQNIENIDIKSSNKGKNKRVKKSEELVCENCKNKKDFDITDNNDYVCLECGTMLNILIHNSSYKDVERVNMSAKYTYDRKVHFRDCINQFQGKQNSSISQKVYDSLMEQFKLHGLLFDKKDVKKITKEHVYLFLKETDNSKHYEDIVLIHYNITGVKPNDISHFESKLLDDFDILTDLYDNNFKKNGRIDRKNFINTQYVLFQLLKRHKYPCKRSDFNILKTIDRKSFHDDICKELFAQLGWNFTAIF